jgi:hypothetical protein
MRENRLTTTKGISLPNLKNLFLVKINFIFIIIHSYIHSGSKQSEFTVVVKRKNCLNMNRKYLVRAVLLILKNLKNWLYYHC